MKHEGYRLQLFLAADYRHNLFSNYQTETKLHFLVRLSMDQGDRNCLN